MSHETAEQTLARIESGFSQNDILSVIYFADCGINPADITPRQNVLTFKAWKAKGRQVAKGAKGLPLTVWVPKKNKEDGCFPKVTRVFHISQTIEQGAEKGTACEAQDNVYLVDADKTNDDARTQKVDAATAQAKAAAELAETDDGEELTTPAQDEAAKLEEAKAIVLVSETVYTLDESGKLVEDTDEPFEPETEDEDDAPEVVKVAEYRDRINHLSRLANCDRHACVSEREARQHIRITRRIYDELTNTTCKRSTTQDDYNRSQILAIVGEWLENDAQQWAADRGASHAKFAEGQRQRAEQEAAAPLESSARTINIMDLVSEDPAAKARTTAYKAAMAGEIPFEDEATEEAAAPAGCLF